MSRRISFEALTILYSIGLMTRAEARMAEEISVGSLGPPGAGWERCVDPRCFVARELFFWVDHCNLLDLGGEQ